MTNSIPNSYNQAQPIYYRPLYSNPGVNSNTALRSAQQNYINDLVYRFPPPAQAQAQYGGMGGALMSLYGNIAGFASSIQQQRQIDRQSGIPLWSGAANAGNQVLGQLQQIYAMQQMRAQQELALRAMLQQSQPANSGGPLQSLEGSFSQLGSIGQKLILNNFRDQAAKWLSNQLGVQPGQASLGGMIDSIFGSTPAASAGSLLQGGTDLFSSGIPEYSDLLEGIPSSFGALPSQPLTLFPEGMPQLSVDGLTATGTEASAGTSSLGGVAGFAGAAYSAYNLFKNWGKLSPVQGAMQGAATGAYIGSVIPGVGTLIGGAVGGIVGALSGLFGSGKSLDQKARDQVRKFLQQGGMVDENWCVTLADGSKYDIGKDGHFTLPNTDGTTRNAYDVDFSNPLAGQVVGWLNPLVATMVGADPKLQSQFVGYFTNAALSNAKDLDSAKQNVIALYKSAGADPTQLAQGLAGLAQQGKINQDYLMAYAGGLQSLFDGSSAAAAQVEEQQQAA